MVGRVVAERPGSGQGRTAALSDRRRRPARQGRRRANARGAQPLRTRIATWMCRADEPVGLLLTQRSRRSVARDGVQRRRVPDRSSPRVGSRVAASIKVVVGIVILALVLLWALRRLSQGHASRSPGRTRALDSARAVRARSGRRRGTDGRRHRAGRRGLGSACLASRRAAGSSRAGAGDDGEEPRQARGEGRPGPGGRARASLGCRRPRRGRSPDRGRRRGRRREGGDLPPGGRDSPASTRFSPRTPRRSRSRRSQQSRVARTRSSGCTSSTRYPC